MIIILRNWCWKDIQAWHCEKRKNIRPAAWDFETWCYISVANQNRTGGSFLDCGNSLRNNETLSTPNVQGYTEQTSSTCRLTWTLATSFCPRRLFGHKRENVLNHIKIALSESAMRLPTWRGTFVFSFSYVQVALTFIMEMLAVVDNKGIVMLFLSCVFVKPSLFGGAIFCV